MKDLKANLKLFLTLPVKIGIVLFICFSILLGVQAGSHYSSVYENPKNAQTVGDLNEDV